MNDSKSESFEAVAVAGKVVGPCGIRIPLVISPQDPQRIVPLDATSPMMRLDELDEAAMAGRVTPLEKHTSVGPNYRVCWTNQTLLRIADITEQWNSLSKKQAMEAKFQDDARRVWLAPERATREMFDAIEKSLLAEYVAVCTATHEPAQLLSTFEPAFNAALYVSAPGSRKRRDLLDHLGHLYRVCGSHLKLKQLYKLEIEVEYRERFDDFVAELRQLQETLEFRMRFQRMKSDARRPSKYDEYSEPGQPSRPNDDEQVRYH